MKNLTKAVLSLVLLLVSSSVAVADVMVSLTPSRKALSGMEENLLKGFQKLNPPQPIPAWVQSYNFSSQPFHITLGYINNIVWRDHQGRIEQIIQHAVSIFEQTNSINFTFYDLQIYGAYISVVPNQETRIKLKALNAAVHSALVKAGFADGLSGKNNWGNPAAFEPHLSIAKVEDLKQHAEVVWRQGVQSGRMRAFPNFTQMFVLYLNSVKAINTQVYSNKPGKPNGYSFKFNTVDVSDSGLNIPIVLLR